MNNFDFFKEQWANLKTIVSPLDNITIIIIGLIGTMFTVISLIASIVSKITGRKEKIPKYLIKSRNLIKGYDKSISDLSILYNQNEISDLTISNIVFWNKGKKTIRQEDIAEGDYLKIKAENNTNRISQILYANIIQHNNNANRIELIPDKNKDIIINFDFLDKGEGAVFQIIHTGITSNDLELTGTIKGYGKIKPHKNKIKFYKIEKNFIKLIRKTLSQKVVIFILIVMPLILLITQPSIKSSTDIDPVKMYERARVFFKVLLSIVFICYWGLAYTLNKTLPPKGLESFFNFFNEEIEEIEEISNQIENKTE